MKYNIGETLICINNQDSDSLELNQEYIVVDINEHGNIGVKCPATGKLLRHYYKPERFQPQMTRKPFAKAGAIYKYKGSSEQLYMIIDTDYGFMLVSLSSGVQHYPSVEKLENTIGNTEDLFERVADSLAEYIANET